MRLELGASGGSRRLWELLESFKFSPATCICKSLRLVPISIWTHFASRQKCNNRKIFFTCAVEEPWLVGDPSWPVDVAWDMNGIRFRTNLEKNTPSSSPTPVCSSGWEFLPMPVWSVTELLVISWRLLLPTTTCSPGKIDCSHWSNLLASWEIWPSSSVLLVLLLDGGPCWPALMKSLKDPEKVNYSDVSIPSSLLTVNGKLWTQNTL